jgi:hypothetical protein
MRIDVHHHFDGLPECDRHLLHQILDRLKELKTMSQTNQEKIDADNAAMAAALDSIQTDVTAITAELQANIPTPGAVPSQASLDALQANVDRLNAVKAALDTLAVPPTP